MMKIYGAGIAGLLAACMFQDAQIYEANKRKDSDGLHRAVLRFKSPAVGDLAGVQFRKVKVHKGIWSQGGCAAPSIDLANMYSKKVIGRLADRSIWNLETADRWIAPDDFQDILVDRCYKRISWGHKIDAETIKLHGGPIISTLPMDKMVGMVDTKLGGAPEFCRSGICTARWKVPGADVFQSIYFPDPTTSLYRASITGDILTAEYVGGNIDRMQFEAFGLTAADVYDLDSGKQEYGKIVPIDDVWRKNFIFNLSNEHDIFSLGRFATWRNIMLDDVVNDIAVIKKLVNFNTYDRARVNVK